MARLPAGILAGHPVVSVMTGEARPRRRPMRRVTGPLQRTGAVFAARSGGRPPLRLRGAGTRGPVSWRPEVASAPERSAMLLVGPSACDGTMVEEPVPTRDHGETMPRHLGAAGPVERAGVGAGGIVRLAGRPSRVARDVLAPGFAVVVEAVGLNPLRTGLFTILIETGTELAASGARTGDGDLAGDPSGPTDASRGIVVPPERASGVTDEHPVLVAPASGSGCAAWPSVG